MDPGQADVENLDEEEGAVFALLALLNESTRQLPHYHSVSDIVARYTQRMRLAFLHAIELEATPDRWEMERSTEILAYDFSMQVFVAFD